jgi:predicted DNA-binding transcriptional regulator AlpA
MILRPLSSLPHQQPLARHLAESRDGVLLEQASGISPESIDWLFYPWIAASKLNVLAGPAGVDKSTLVFSIAVTISCGGMWPDNTLANPGVVIIWSGKDGVEGTIIPRLIAANANMSNVCIVRTIRVGGRARSFNPAKDMPELQAAIARLGLMCALWLSTLLRKRCPGTLTRALQSVNLLIRSRSWQRPLAVQFWGLRIPTRLPKARSRWSELPAAWVVVLSIRDLLRRIGLSKATLYNMTNPGSKYFDPVLAACRIQLTSKSVGFIESKVNAWLESRMATDSKGGLQ